MIWTFSAFVLTLFTRTAFSEFTCFLDLKPDPSHKGERRWGLLIDKSLRCSCTKILAKSTTPTLSCFSQPSGNDATEIWFTDTPGLLSDRRVWNTEKLKYLLNCSYIDEDECDPNKCQNGATCIDELFGYRCLCADGYVGDNCQTALCEPSWYRFESYCYYLHDDNEIIGMFFDEADDHCQNLKGNLTSIHSSKELEFIIGLIGSADLGYWIGLTDSVTENSFVWTDNTEVNYTNWGSTDPNGGDGENCVGISPINFKWADMRCNSFQHFICKKKVTTA